MPAPNPDPFSASSDEVESAAADWLARRDAGWSPEDQRQFELWLRKDARHGQAWAALDSTWAAFDRPRSVGTAGAMIRELAARQRRRRRRWVAGAGAAVALAASIALVAWPRTPKAVAGEAVLSTVNRQVLADGSIVELNLGAGIEVDYQPETRRVRLVRGEAHFAVAKNPARPFVVTAGGVKVWAVGTAFAVKLGPAAVDVLVTEGRVAVDRPPVGEISMASVAPASRAVLVPAGERLVVPVDAPPAATLQPEVLARGEIERRLAWRGPRLELSGTPLSRAIAVFNRENPVHLSIDDPTLGEMRMSGIFRADNAEGFVRLLEANYGVKAERRDGGEITLRRGP